MLTMSGPPQRKSKPGGDFPTNGQIARNRRLKPDERRHQHGGRGPKFPPQSIPRYARRSLAGKIHGSGVIAVVLGFERGNLGHRRR